MGEHRKTATRPILAYLVVWALSVGAFWILMDGSDAMGYAIVFVWVLNPVAVFVTSFLAGRGSAPGDRLWIAPILLGTLYMLLPYLTFSLSNTLSSGNVNMPDARMLLFGAAVSTVGLCSGRFVRALAARRAKPRGEE